VKTKVFPRGTDVHAARPHRSRRPAHRAASVAFAAVAALGLGVSCGGGDPEGSTTYEVEGVEVQAIARAPERVDGPTITVLFLHGQAYSSRIWDDRGILDDVVDAGYRAVAVDLPGRGGTSERSEKARDETSDGAWLRKLVDEVGKPELTVVVSPSMSGRYSLAMFEEFPDEELAGFVPVAPVGADDFERPTDAAPIPNLIVYGADDPEYAQLRAEHLSEQLRSPTSAIAVIPDAGHAAYDDQPDRFTDFLVGFLAQLEP
jgi:abhydrolase domain-containing protein 14